MILELRTVRRLVALVAVMATLVLQMQFAARPASAAASRSGDAEAVQANNRLRPFTEGTHESAFSLRLPRGATCPGDSMNDDWRVQSFVVPSTDDPGALRYMVTGPEGPENDARVAIYTSNCSGRIPRQANRGRSSSCPRSASNVCRSTICRAASTAWELRVRTEREPRLSIGTR